MLDNNFYKQHLSSEYKEQSWLSAQPMMKHFSVWCLNLLRAPVGANRPTPEGCKNLFEVNFAPI